MSHALMTTESSAWHISHTLSQSVSSLDKTNVPWEAEFSVRPCRIQLDRAVAMKGYLIKLLQYAPAHYIHSVRGLHQLGYECILVRHSAYIKM